MEKTKIQKLRHAFFVTGIFVLVCVVLWIVGYAIQGLIVEHGDLSWTDYLESQWHTVTYYFSSDMLKTLFSSDIGTLSLAEISIYVAAVIVIIGFIIAIVLACVKKKWSVFLTYLPLVVLGYGIFEMAYWFQDMGNFGSTQTTGAAIYLYIYLVVYVLAIVSVITWWIYSLVIAYYKEPVASFEEPNESEQYISAEGIVFTPEDVEPEPIPMYIAEPEPEVEEVPEPKEPTPAPEPAPSVVINNPAPNPTVVVPPSPAAAPAPTPIVVTAPSASPTPTVIVTPVPTPAPAPAPAPEPSEKPITRSELVEILREIVRETVRDEVARTTANNEEEEDVVALGDSSNRSHSLTGASFGGPLVVQYFNGPAPHHGPEGPCEGPCEEPCKEPCKEEEPVTPVVVNVYNTGAPVTEENVVEKVKEPAPAPEVAPIPEAVPAPEVAPAPKAAPAPVAAAPAPSEEPNPNKIIRIPFTTRIVAAEEEMKDNYNVLKNTILSYGVNSRVSNSGDTFRLHRKTYVKITIAGKSLKLYFALNPDDYKEGTIPVQNAGNKGIYADIPLVFKVKSGLSLRRAIQLIADVMEKDDLEQGEIGEVDWVKEIAAHAPSDEDKEA